MLEERGLRDQVGTASSMTRDQVWALEEVLAHGPYRVKVRAKGQVTIPAAIRRTLEIQAGDLFSVQLVPEGILFTPWERRAA